MMDKQWIITVSFDGQREMQCMPLDNCSTGLGLAADGVTWYEQSDALLYIGEHNELMIKCMGDVLIEIERFGRRLRLRHEHPVRVLAGDIIRIGDTSPHTFDIRHIYCTRKTSVQINRLSKMAMIACATAMFMTCSLACNRTAPNHPANAILSSEPPESVETEENILTETDVRLMLPNYLSGIRPQDYEDFGMLIKYKTDFVDKMRSNVVEQSSETSQPDS